MIANLNDARAAFVMKLGWRHDMGMLSDFLERQRKARINRALEATLKPDPDFRARRLAQFSPERRQRYFENVERIGHG